MEFLKAIIKPFRSRKVRTALATVIVAIIAEYGFAVSEQIVMSILGVGISVILGIAHEDAGAKSQSKITVTTREKV